MSRLVVEQLSVAYGERTVLHDLSLACESGQVLGLIGPNGAGKTTLLRALSGTLPAVHGQVLLDGVDLLRLRPDERARRVAVVPQAVQLPAGFSVAEVVLMGRTPHLPRFGGERAHDREIAQQAMQRTDVWELRDRWLGELSGGERQRVLVARALAQEPQVLLLDEATAHLDLRHQAAVFDIARELARAGLLVIAALHDLNLAALYADRLALLSQGQLIAYDTPEQVLTPALLRQVYGVEVVVTRHPLHQVPLVALAARDKDSPL